MPSDSSGARRGGLDRKGGEGEREREWGCWERAWDEGGEGVLADNGGEDEPK